MPIHPFQIDVPTTISTEYLLAVGLLVVAWLAARLFAALLRPAVRRRTSRENVVDIVLRVVRVVVVVAAIFAALAVVGVEITGLLFSVTIISAVLVLVLAPIATDFVAGFLILLNRPYEVGDLIELIDADERGYVEDITLRFTRIALLENTYLVVPNSTIYERDVINYSAADIRTRVAIEFPLSHEGDLAEARRRCEQAAAGVDGVLAGDASIRLGETDYATAPRAFIDRIDDLGVWIALHVWVEQPFLPVQMRSQIHDGIREAIASADAEIADQRMRLSFDDGDRPPQHAHPRSS